MSHLVNKLRGDPRSPLQRTQGSYHSGNSKGLEALFQEPGTKTIQILYYITNTLLYNKHLTGYKHWKCWQTFPNCPPKRLYQTCSAISSECVWRENSNPNNSSYQITRECQVFLWDWAWGTLGYLSVSERIHLYSCWDLQRKPNICKPFLWFYVPTTRRIVVGETCQLLIEIRLQTSHSWSLTFV